MHFKVHQTSQTIYTLSLAGGLQTLIKEFATPSAKFKV
jgi:hypothetical protein